MPKAKLIRGNCIYPLMQHIQSTYDSKTQQSIYEHLSDTSRETLGQVSVDEWYPATIAAEMYRGIFHAHPEPQQGYEAVRASGSAIAEYCVSTFMRLLIKLMTPEMLAKKWPTIWSKSHNFGHMETSLDKDRERRMLMTLSEMDDYSFIGPCAAGFIGFSLRAMGRQASAVVELDVDYARETCPSYTFEVTW